MRKLTGWPRPQGTMLNDSGGGPWGGRGGGGSGGGSGGNNGGDGGGPRNPWNMPPEGGKPRGPRPGQGSTALDQLLRRSRARFGRGGGMPDLGGRPFWAYALITFLAIWVILTSVHRIGPAERGVVLRFGRYAGTMEPGIGFTFPAPVDQVVKVGTEDRSLEIGSTSSSSENLVPTRDENVINLAWTARWSVADPAQYLLQLAEPEDVIRDVAESAMRATIGSMTLADIAAGREAIEQKVAERMQATLNKYHAGVNVEGVTVRQVAAPAQVGEVAKKVAAAHQKAQSYVDDARNYAQQQTAKAESEAAAFDKIYAQYKAAPDVTRRRLYYDTMEEVLSKADKTIVDAPGVNLSLPAPPAKRAPAQEPQQ